MILHFNQLLVLIVLYKRTSTVWWIHCVKYFIWCGLARREHSLVESVYQFYGWKLVCKTMLPQTPKDVHVLIPGTCEHTMLYGREELRLQMKVMLLICWPWDGKIILNYLGWPTVITKALTGGRGRLKTECYSDVRGERLGKCCWFWRWRKGHWTKHVGSL